VRLVTVKLDMVRIKDAILKEFQHQHKLGEAAGESGHLAYTSVTRLEAATPRDVVQGKRRAIEVPFTVETYTETEFLHSPEEDIYYKLKYVGKIVLDAAMNVLDFNSASP
jgi:hypothetical protein